MKPILLGDTSKVFLGDSVPFGENVTMYHNGLHEIHLEEKTNIGKVARVGRIPSESPTSNNKRQRMEVTVEEKGARGNQNGVGQVFEINNHGNMFNNFAQGQVGKNMGVVHINNSGKMFNYF